MSQIRRLACVVGARPNFVKMAPILAALRAYPHILPILVHTGQHHDANLSQVFFEELGLPTPDAFLAVGSGSHGQQTGRILERFEQLLQCGAPENQAFDRVLVVGDVNSTLACALAASKLRIPVAHVEAGLRSFDRAMPEEINRVLTDSLADCLFVSDPTGVDNLLGEGHAKESIHLVGNVMVDTLFQFLTSARQRDTLTRMQLQPRQYGVVTLHRPANVDSPATLSAWVGALRRAARDIPLVFVLHPRTEDRLRKMGLWERLRRSPGIQTVPALGYLDFLCLTSQCRLAITDSGGLQEEMTALEIPCLTLRDTTERPITVEEGGSTLIGYDILKLLDAIQAILLGQYAVGKCPILWDGKAAKRIAAIVADLLR